MQAAELVARKLERHPDPTVNGYVKDAAGTVDEAAITSFLGGASVEDLPDAARADVARKLWVKLQDWTPALWDKGSAVPGTPVNAATLAAIIDRLEA